MISDKRIKKTFLELVRIDSPSGSEGEIRKELARRLRELGGKTRTDEKGNLIGHLPGEGEPVMLNAHMDTVEPGREVKPKVQGDKVTSDGTTILGADCKSGVTAILEALTSLREEGATHRPVDVVFTVEEELGCLGSAAFDVSQLRASKGFVFDAGERPNEICISSPHGKKVSCQVTGKGAHAGVEPENGISAIRVGAELISQLKLGRIDEKTTANVGMIEGGSARNAVPETTSFEGEMRSRSEKRLERLMEQWMKAVEKTRAKHPKAKIEMEFTSYLEGYEFSEGHPLVREVGAAMKGAGMRPKLRHSGGGTDVNNFLRKGIDAVGIGISARNMHTKREETRLPEIAKVARVARSLVVLPEA